MHRRTFLKGSVSALAVAAVMPVMADPLVHDEPWTVKLLTQAIDALKANDVPGPYFYQDDWNDVTRTKPVPFSKLREDLGP